MADNDNHIEEEEDEEQEEQDYVIEGENEGGIFRWMSAAVVLLAVAGFFGLAWYAYKSGGEVVDEKDAELIQADNTPVKEAPANPGGMPIPNQDKSVYSLVGGGKKEEPKVVEHILSSPETPIVASADDGDTSTWMSDQVKSKLHAGEEGAPVTEEKETAADAGAEKPLAKPAEETTKAKPADETAAAAPKAEQFKTTMQRQEEKTASDPLIRETPSADTPKEEVKKEETPAVEAKKEEPAPAAAKVEDKPVVSPVPPTPESLKAESKKEEKPVVKEEPKEPVKKPEVKKEAPRKKRKKSQQPLHPAGARAQLGAFKSQKEAEEQWKKNLQKFSEDLSGKNHYIVRAEVAGKGTFYRLQVAPFDSSRDVERFCISLVSDGQSCITAKGK